MKLFNKKPIAVLLASVMLCCLLFPVLTACNKKPSEDDSLYTYREYISKFPATWNTHNGTTDADEYIQGYTEMGLYDITLSEDRTTYAFVDEMATGDPKDVTAQNTGKYGISEGDTGKAWEITLNPDATFENGTKITAEDYVWSMERLLSPEMKNSGSSTFITGDYELYNAKNYYSFGSTEEYFKINAETTYTDDELEQMVQDGLLYFSFTKTPIFDTEGSFTIEGHHNIESQKKFYLNENGEDVYEILHEKYAADANEFGYILITEENFSDFKTNLSVLSASALGALMPNWYDLLSVLQAATPVYTKITAETEYDDAAINTMIENKQLYFSFTKTPIFDTEGSFTIEGHHNIESQRKFYKNADGEDVYDILYKKYAASANEYGYILITKENVEDFKTNLSVLSASALGALMPNWYDLLSVVSYEESVETPFANVGIFKKDDMHFVMVFVNSLTTWQVKYLLTDNWLVYKEYYEEGYSQQGSLTVTSYGTTSGKYMGYGPYKLSAYEKDKEITFVRNENWYGYNENATNYHEGQFQTDKIVCQIISNQATALLEFESGNLDSVKLTSDNLSKYKFSDYLLKRTASNTWSITFNSNADKLKAIESDGQGNRRILSVTEFRKALSLCLDRSYIGQNILAGSAAAYSFINDNYYYDIENDPNSIYRNSEQAKQSIVDLYGVEYGPGKTYETLDEAYRAITGYDIGSAKEYFTQAYTYAKANNLYTDGETIKINIYNNATSSQLSSLEQYMQTQINKATEGTALSGKIKVEFKAQQNGRLESIAQGQIEAVYYSYSGDYNDPNGMLGNFTDASQTTLIECGFDPTKETFSVTCDFEDGKGVQTLTKSYYDWQKSISAGGTYASKSNTVKLAIMSALEYNLLSGFRTLPLCVGTDLTLRSKKVNYATETSNIFAMYGGVRLMTYNYNNGEWAKFCKDKDNLNYAS